MGALVSFSGCSINGMRKWEMETEGIDAILEKIWELHDKLGDAIHSVSRTHFLNSVKTALTNPHNPTPGFVFVKDFHLHVDDDDDDDDESALHEAKGLDAIRTALGNLEDRLVFLHTIQTRQRVERDAALSGLEQTRIVLAMRLAEHHGRKFKVIEEALAFVGDLHDQGCLLSPENLYGQPNCSSAENFANDRGKRSNIFINVLVSSFNFAKKYLTLDHVGGIVGNTALVAVSMIALLHLPQVTYPDHTFRQENNSDYSNRTVRRTTQLEGSSSSACSSNLDVLLARG